MRILILGSGSFAGQALFSNLFFQDYDVHGINRSLPLSSSMWEWQLNLNKKLNWHQCNIHSQPDRMVNLIREINPTHVVDFMGQGMVAQSWDDPRLWYKTNIAEKSYVLEEIRKISNLQKYVRISTPEVFGSNQKFLHELSEFNPSTPYAVSHASIDYHVRCLGKQFDFPFVIGRFANFYGEGQQLYRVIPRLILSCLTSNKFILDGGGKSSRFFINSKDVVSSIKLLLFKSANKKEYNFSGDQEITILDLCKLICKLTGTNFQSIVNFGPERKGKDQFYRLNCTKALEELNWKPSVNLEDGIVKTISWIDRNIDKLKRQSWNYEHSS